MEYVLHYGRYNINCITRNTKIEMELKSKKEQNSIGVILFYKKRVDLRKSIQLHDYVVSSYV